jgi:hypothetical protein
LFGGLSLDEIALAQGISRATVEREWQAAAPGCTSASCEGQLAGMVRP